MNTSGSLAVKVVNTVGSHDTPPNVTPWFGMYDRPIARSTRLAAEDYRVESFGWDYAAKEIVYALHDRFSGSDAVMVIKESALVPPLVVRGATVDTLKMPFSLPGSRGTARVVGIRAVRATYDNPQSQEFRYAYELRFDAGGTETFAEHDMEWVAKTDLSHEKPLDPEVLPSIEKEIKGQGKSFI